MKKRGSILIWTMFISLFVVSFFIAMQSNFLNYLNLYENSSQKQDFSVRIEELKHTLVSNPQKITYLSGYIIKSLNYNSIWYSWSLNYNETTEYLITLTWWTSNLSWKVNLGALEFLVLSFNDSASTSIISSWTISEGDTKSIPIDLTKKFNIITVRNLWWILDYHISRWNTNLLAQKEKYLVYRDYKSRQQYITSFELENFKKKSQNINYDNYSIFLNSSNYE